MARFQARSAFTGTRFTTAEAETVVQHPVLVVYGAGRAVRELDDRKRGAVGDAEHARAVASRQEAACAL